MTDSENRQDASLIGRTLGRCAIESKLGAGGMGLVYLATHQGLNRKVAVKVLPEDLAENDDLFERFHREAISTASLEHPNIVRVFDVDIEDDIPYLVMQYIEGESLSERLKSDHKPTTEEALEIIFQVALGLEHAHDRGVIHRDIKPANILLDNQGTAVLTDFGLAVAPKKTQNRLTTEDALVGTLHYMAPEVADGVRDDPRSDLYGLGVTFYELLVGEKPFEGASGFSVIHRQMTEKPDPVHIRNPELPSTLSLILNRLLSYNIDGRYNSTREFIDELSWYRERGEVLTPQHVPWEASTNLKTTAIVLFTLLLGVGLWWFSKEPPHIDSNGSEDTAVIFQPTSQEPRTTGDKPSPHESGISLDLPPEVDPEYIKMSTDLSVVKSTLDVCCPREAPGWSLISQEDDGSIHVGVPPHHSPPHHFLVTREQYAPNIHFVGEIKVISGSVDLVARYKIPHKPLVQAIDHNSKLLNKDEWTKFSIRIEKGQYVMEVGSFKREPSPIPEGTHPKGHTGFLYQRGSHFHFRNLYFKKSK